MSLVKIIPKKDLLIALLGSIFTFFLASILMSGWPNGLVPNIEFPFGYEGDSLATAWAIKRILEDALWLNFRSGYPFGSNLLDFPGSDVGIFIVFKAIGLFTRDWIVAHNIFFLLSFPVVFFASYIVFRKLNVIPALAFSGAIIYDFVAFHIARIGHLYYTWYFVVPIFFLASFYLFNGVEIIRWRKRAILSAIFVCLICIFLASYGVYYAFFGALTVAVGVVGGAFRKGSFKFLMQGALIFFILLGVFLNLQQSILYQREHGVNKEVAQRLPVESEIYGLRLRQMVLPRWDHRSHNLSSITKKYWPGAPKEYYELSSSIGFLPSIGFFYLGIILFALAAGKKFNSRQRFLALSTWFLFLFATVGGFGALFAGLVSPSIRALDRLNIFIAFGSVAGLLVFIQSVFSRFELHRRLPYILVIISILLISFAIWDQNIPVNTQIQSNIKAQVRLERNFIHEIERISPVHTAIYQLPYISFPEEPPKFHLPSYVPLSGFTYSNNLRWNFGGMKGRDGDLFFRQLSSEPIAKQIEVIRRLGFGGLYIDKRGYEDEAKSLITEVQSVLGTKPTLIREDGNVLFFKINQSMPLITENQLVTSGIYERAEYWPDYLGRRYKSTLSTGIDFTRADWPSFLNNIKGVSLSESWGRWSDANLFDHVVIEFRDALPNQFTLFMDIRPMKLNEDKNLRLQIGFKQYLINMGPGRQELRVNINLEGQSVKTIEIFPPNPIAPSDLGVNRDTRKLGVGFTKIWIVENGL